MPGPGVEQDAQGLPGLLASLWSQREAHPPLPATVPAQRGPRQQTRAVTPRGPGPPQIEREAGMGRQPQPQGATRPLSCRSPPNCWSERLHAPRRPGDMPWVLRPDVVPTAAASRTHWLSGTGRWEQRPRGPAG